MSRSAASPHGQHVPPRDQVVPAQKRHRENPVLETADDEAMSSRAKRHPHSYLVPDIKEPQGRAAEIGSQLGVNDNIGDQCIICEGRNKLQQGFGALVVNVLSAKPVCQLCDVVLRMEQAVYNGVGDLYWTGRIIQYNNHFLKHIEEPVDEATTGEDANATATVEVAATGDVVEATSTVEAISDVVATGETVGRVQSPPDATARSRIVAY